MAFPWGKKKLNRSWYGTLMLFSILGLFGAFMALPLIYTINNAFKPLDEDIFIPSKIFC